MPSKRAPKSDQQVEFPLPGGGIVTLPTIPKKDAREALARRLQPIIGKSTAIAFSDICLHPEVVRKDLTAQKFEDLPLPPLNGQSGLRMRCLEADAASLGPVNDGRNGRTESKMHMTPGAPRPWPLPSPLPTVEAGEPAVGLRYRVSSAQRAADAVAYSAKLIFRSSLAKDVARHGVWNPPVVGPAQIADAATGSVHDRVATLDGASRITVQVKSVGIAVGAPSGWVEPSKDHPLVRAGVPLWARQWAGRSLLVPSVPDMLSEVRAALAEKLISHSHIPSVVAAARAFTIRVRLVLGVVDQAGNLINDADLFLKASRAFIEAAHTQTEAWDATGQHGAHGEDMVVALRDAGRIAPDMADELLVGSDDLVSTLSPDMAAAHLVRLVTDTRNDDVLSTALLEDEARDDEQSILRAEDRGRYLAPLLVRLFRDDPNLADTAESAFAGGFILGRELRSQWEITGAPAERLHEEAVAFLAKNPNRTGAASREMVARFGTTAIAWGLILSDQGSQTPSKKDPRRGHARKVLRKLATTRWGLQTLCDVGVALERGTGTKVPIRNEDGSTVTKQVAGTLDVERYTAAGGSANQHIRTVLFGDPEEADDGANDATRELEPEPLTPEEAAAALVERSVGQIAAALSFANDAIALTGADGRPSLSRGDIPAELARVAEADLTALLKLFSRYGADEVPIPQFSGVLDARAYTDAPDNPYAADSADADDLAG